MMSGVFVADFRIVASQTGVLNTHKLHWLAFTLIAYAEFNKRSYVMEFKVSLRNIWESWVF